MWSVTVAAERFTSIGILPPRLRRLPGAFVRPRRNRRRQHGEALLRAELTARDEAANTVSGRSKCARLVDSKCATFEG